MRFDKNGDFQVGGSLTSGLKIQFRQKRLQKNPIY